MPQTTSLDAWKVDDYTWRKNRQAQWGEVKKSLAYIGGITDRDHKHLKNYFLTGRLDENELLKKYPVLSRHGFSADRPLYAFEPSILLECWLSADHSENNWYRIRANYCGEHLSEALRRAGQTCLQNSIKRFLDTMNWFPETGSLFNGLEERLYRFLCPQSYNPESYPGWTSEQIQYLAARNLFYLSQQLDVYLNQSSPNPYNFIRYRIEELSTAVVPASQYMNKSQEFDIKKVLSRLKNSVGAIVNSETDKLKLDIAIKLNAKLFEHDITKSHFLNEYLA